MVPEESFSFNHHFQQDVHNPWHPLDAGRKSPQDLPGAGQAVLLAGEWRLTCPRVLRPLSVASGVRWHFCFHPFVQQVCFWDWQVTRYWQVFKRWTASGRAVRCQFSLAGRKCHVTEALRPLPHCSCEGVSLLSKVRCSLICVEANVYTQRGGDRKVGRSVDGAPGFRQWSAS